MRKRPIVAGLVGFGVLLGAYVSGLIPKFGTGSSNGTVSAVPTDKGGTAKGPAPTDPKAKPATNQTPATAQTKAPSTTATQNGKAPPASNTQAANQNTSGRNQVMASVPKLPVLEVYVRGERYQIKDPSGSGELLYIKLPDILRMAKATTGNDEGIRVRILQFRSAKYVTAAQLYEELNGAGLDNDVIRMPKKLLDDPKPAPKAQANATGAPSQERASAAPANQPAAPAAN